MAPPTATLNLDVEAISGICGSISIACWVVVFSPQIVENFRRSSAEGLSIQFIIVWLFGDFCNILGAVLQGVLPTMTILAIYYTIADLVLLGQCFYYRGFTWRDHVAEPAKPKPKPKPKPPRARDDEFQQPDERAALLAPTSHPSTPSDRERRGSDWSASLSHLSPAVPRPPTSRRQAASWNALAILMVCAAGVAGWWLSRGVQGGGEGGAEEEGEDDALRMDLWGQIFGWLCAVLYLGSRLPQLLLNFRRKSTEGVSMLFFLFACLGNLTYVLSILAYEPRCGGPACLYGRYVLVNLSWLAGSAGTLLLDLGIFVQFFMYDNNHKGRGEEEEYGEEGATEFGDEEEEDRQGNNRWDQRPVLQRNDSR